MFRSLTPHCRWYQRESFIFLTVEVMLMMMMMTMMIMLMMTMMMQVMDCKSPDISVMDAKLFFRCVGEDGKQYELDLELLRDINTKEGGVASLAFLRQNIRPPGFDILLCYPLLVIN